MKRLSLGLCILLLLAVTACGPETPRQPTEALTLGLPLQPSSALMLVALERKLFRAQGLQVQVKEYPSGKRALREGLFTGEVDLVSTADMPLTIAAFEREDFRLLATLFSASNVNRVVARRDLGIATAADLRGRRLATQRASAVHFFLHLFLLEQGIDSLAVEIDFMRAEKLPQALVSGRVEAFSMREPFVSEAVELLGERALVMAAPGIYEQMEILVAGEALLRQRPAVVRRVLQALLEAEDFVRRHPQQAAELVARRLQVDAVRIQAILPEYTLRVGLEQSLLLLLEDQARWAKQAGLVQGEVPDYLRLFHLDALAGLAGDRVTVMR